MGPDMDSTVDPARAVRHLLGAFALLGTVYASMNIFVQENPAVMLETDPKLPRETPFNTHVHPTELKAEE